jgi:diguanylate cyclase (GGDEF)-like protein
MLTEHIYYQEERAYAVERFVFWVVATIVAFLLSGFTDKELGRLLLMTGFVLLVVDAVGALYYYIVAYRPDMSVTLRKSFITLFDTAVVTYLVHLYGSWGIFLFPLYFMVVLRAGEKFGLFYLYVALGGAAIGWSFLAFVSPYWSSHAQIVTAFALSVVSVALFVMRRLIALHQENYELEEVLPETEYDDMLDMLTELPNKAAYKERLQDLLHEKKPFSAFFIDIDKFKAINETFGRQGGDEILREVGRRLLEQIGEEEFLARLGADEFVILSTRDVDGIDKLLKKIERNVIGRHRIGRELVPIELSIGVSRYPDDAQTAMMIGKCADIALRAAQEDDTRYHYYYRELSSERRDELSER